MTRIIAAWILATAAVACTKPPTEQARVYVYNGTGERVTVSVTGGGTPVEVLLRPGMGRLLGERPEKRHTFNIRYDSGKLDKHVLDLKKKTFSVVNVGGAGCFARADVSGMYVDGRELVEVNEIYVRESLFSMKTVVHVAPDERLPSEKPKSPFGFHRLAVVNCDDTGDRYAVSHYIKELR